MEPVRFLGKLRVTVFLRPHGDIVNMGFPNPGEKDIAISQEHVASVLQTRVERRIDQPLH